MLCSSHLWMLDLLMIRYYVFSIHVSDNFLDFFNSRKMRFSFNMFLLKEKKNHSVTVNVFINVTYWCIYCWDDLCPASPHYLCANGSGWFVSLLMFFFFHNNNSRKTMWIIEMNEYSGSGPKNSRRKSIRGNYIFILLKTHRWNRSIRMKMWKLI